MQIMGSCCSLCSDCLRNFTSKSTETYYLFPTSPHQETSPIKTVRRISSVGQTVTNEDGEEIEMPRHSSVLQSYNGVPIPWTSNAITIQPGVSKTAIENRLRNMPTISEVPFLPLKKSKQLDTSWKFNPSTKEKKIYSLKKYNQDKKTNTGEETQIYRNIQKTGQEYLPKNYQHNEQKIQLNLRRGSYSSTPNLLNLEQVNEKNTSSSNQTLDSVANVPLQNNLAKSTTWLHSQSLEEVVESKKLKAELLARQYGLDLSLYKEVKAVDHFHQIGVNLHPADVQMEESEGFVEFSVYINSSQNMLSIFLSRVGDLSGVGEYREPYSTVVKVSLVSDKTTAKTSKKLAPNLNPVINQSFTFFSKTKINRIIRISVFNSNFVGRFDAIGHTLVPLEEVDYNKNYKMKLYKRTMLTASTGMMQISCYLKEERFSINVLKVINLSPQFKNRKIYVKISYYSMSRKNKEKISLIFNNEHGTLDVNHQANFRIDVTGKKHSFFVISLKKRGTHTVFKNDLTIGRIFLGPSFYSEKGTLTPWGRSIVNNETLCFTSSMCL